MNCNNNNRDVRQAGTEGRNGAAEHKAITHTGVCTDCWSLFWPGGWSGRLSWDRLCARRGILTSCPRGLCGPRSPAPCREQGQGTEPLEFPPGREGSHEFNGNYSITTYSYILLKLPTVSLPSQAKAAHSPWRFIISLDTVNHTLSMVIPCAVTAFAAYLSSF